MTPLSGQSRFCIAARPNSRSTRTLCKRPRDPSEGWFDDLAAVERNRTSGHCWPVCVECEAVAGVVG